MRWMICIGAAFVAGVAFAVALPPRGWGFLAWFCFMPLLWAVRGQGAFKGIISGLAFGFAGALTSISPLSAPVEIADGSIGWNLVGFGIYAVVLSILLGVLAEVRQVTLMGIARLAALGVLVEGLTFLKLPAQVALTQYDVWPMLRVASVTGAWGVSFLIWSANLLVLWEPWKLWRLAPAAVFGLASGLLAQTPPLDTFTAGKVAVVQAPGEGAAELLRMRTNTALIVWPEVSTRWFERGDLLLAAHGGPAIVTSMHDEHKPKPHNAAYAFSINGQSLPYFKRKPFGGESAIITAGDSPRVVEVGGTRIGLNICFDSCFPWVMRDTVRAGAQVIALPTLDPMSPNGFIQAVHGAMTPFRAAELGVPILRSEWTAWSMIVDADGRILSQAPTGWRGTLGTRQRLTSHSTVYRSLGDWFAYLCGAVVLSGLVLKKRGKKLRETCRQ